MTDWHRETADYWDDKSVMVTGGAGFLGSHLVEELERRSYDIEIVVTRSNEYDLRNRDEIEQALVDSEPDVVVYLAATVGWRGSGRIARTPGNTSTRTL